MRDHRPLAGLATDLGLALLEPSTVPMASARGRHDTRELPLRTRPMPVVRPHPVRRYPPSVPASPSAVTTFLPVVA